MDSRPRVLWVGGKKFNIPRELEKHFDVVRQIEQDERKIGILPRVDYVFVLCNWVNHGAIAACRKQLPDKPLIWLNKGWNAMEAELLRRGILRPAVASPPPVEQAVASPPPVEQAVASQPPVEHVVEQKPQIERREPPTAPPVETLEGWIQWVHRWARIWASRINRPANEIAECAISGPDRADDFRDWLKLTPEQADDIWVGFKKSRSLFARYSGRPKKSSKTKGIVEAVKRAVRLMAKLTRLRDQRSRIERSIEDVSSEIEKLKPVLSAVEQIERAMHGQA